MNHFIKDPARQVDYKIDWSAWLNGEAIQSSSWDVPPGITLSDSAVQDTAAVIWLDGGVVGEVYTITNTIVTESGRDNKALLFIQVAESLLERGKNSFQTSAEATVAISNMPQLTALRDSDKLAVENALIQAWYNIGLLSVRIPTKTAGCVCNTEDLDGDLLDELEDRTLRKLRRAQLIEANLLLGANPIEDRRRMGIISDSNGESAQFFRTRVPLQLPVYRETANALHGVIVYSIRASR